MRTTVDIPEPLLRQARARAALEGRKLKDIVNDALTRLLSRDQEPPDEEPAPHLPEGVHLETVGRFRFPLIKSKVPGEKQISPEALKEADTEEDSERHAALFGR
jgi:hypothetical protein